MKKPKKDAPKCPFCSSHPTIKKGLRQNKNRTIQKYQCKNRSCQKFFTLQPKLQKHKTYPIALILQAISNINLGYSLKQTKNYFKKHKIPRSTLSYWYSQLKPVLSYHRIRSDVKKLYKPIEIMQRRNFIHQKQPFLYQYHKPKADLFLKEYPSLKHYLENLNSIIPKAIFSNSQRISKIAKISTTAAKLEIKQNYAVKLADLAMQLAEDKKQRHSIIESIMLINDTATIAVEIPVYLQTSQITGHIDILQMRYNKLHILDFKPEKTNNNEAISQLTLYAKALSNITKIPIKNFKCAFFNNKAYCEFCPR